MAADKKPVIVIKKITVNGGGHHGGSWKVAFADFMTAMMAFFLVMWLLNTSEETKKQIARYFSGPSVVEQNFSIYGAELTLEKLFLDLVNEPLKAFQQFVQPADLTPDIMSLGSKKAVLFHIAQSLGASARNVKVAHDEISFELDDYLLFERGKTDPSNRFVEIMEKVKALTAGLEHGKVEVSSLLNINSVEGRNENLGARVSTERMDIIKTQVAEAFESDTNILTGQALIDLKPLRPNAPGGSIKITIRQKEVLPDGRKPRPIEGEVSEKNNDSTVYNDFVRRMSEGQQKRRR